MKIGLLFGSFNPLHIGHLAIANYMAEFTGLQQVWMVVSPCNPLKKSRHLTMSDPGKRLMRLKKAIGKNPKIKVSDIEFYLPKPSYTINTLELLKKKYPQHKFILIIGTDILNTFHKWKDYKKILSKYKIYVYPRLCPVIKWRLRENFKNHPNIKLINAPRIDISSAFIRESIRKRKDMRYFIR